MTKASMKTTVESAEPAQVSQKSHWLTTWLTGIPGWTERNFGNHRFVLALLMVVVLVMSVPLVVTPLEIWQQAVVAIALMLVGWFIVRLEQQQSSRERSEYLHMFLVWLSLVTTLRYLYYRTNYTLNLDGWVNGFFSLLLFAAELYAIATLMLAYFQTAKQRDRQSVPMDHIPESQWFKVDIYIPTYNEDVEIVRKTALAAIAIDYPADKKRVYVLDDGRAEKYRARREELRRMCEEVGCTMLTRDNNDHAKAGNINTAMRRTGGDLILILDCDHIPTRSILKETVGFFLNPKVALVQTPHWFYNPDPFERNLLTQGRVPVGNELFYKVLQKGNDYWNAAFFCGSAAVIRKKYVLEVGGIAVETVTEDCHTSLRLHSLGYESVYYDKIMVAGLAPEKFSSYVGQQVRWARGMAQILRLENPLFNRKLNLTMPQRVCYLSATTHFFFGFPRLMYAIAPVLYLLFGINSIRGLGVETLFYALPHILLAMNANYITYKNVRYSFWNEIFEYAMAFQDGIVTFMALINPKLGSFNVTDKGVSVTKRSFDWDSARVPVMVGALIIISLLAVPFWLLLRPEESQAVIINALWNIFNLMLLTAAVLVAFEQPQLRRTHRLNRQLNAVIYGPDRTWTGRTLDISESGTRVVLDNWPNLPDEIELEIIGDYGARAFVNGRIIRVSPLDEDEVVLAIDFVNLSRSQFDSLVVVLYSDVSEWYSQNRTEKDNPWASLGFLLTGLWRAFSDPKPAAQAVVRKTIQTPAQLYWDGHFYPAMATAMNSNSILLEFHDVSLPNQEEMQRSKPAVGLLISQYPEDPAPKRLLAEVEQVKGDRSELTLELNFPQQLSSKQGGKIKQLLHLLN